MPSILEIMTKAGIAGDKFAAFLKAVEIHAPILKPKLDEVIADINQAVSVDNAAQVALTLPVEAIDAAHLKFHPRRSPSNAA